MDMSVLHGQQLVWLSSCFCFLLFCFFFEEWTAGLEGYSLSSRRNIALRNDSQSCGVLYSKAPTYFCGQTLTFRQVLSDQLLFGTSTVNQYSFCTLLYLNCMSHDPCLSSHISSALIEVTYLCLSLLLFTSTSWL